VEIAQRLATSSDVAYKTFVLVNLGSKDTTERKRSQYLADMGKNYPHLATMVRDILAVPATGAGVERQFSKSGKVEPS